MSVTTLPFAAALGPAAERLDPIVRRQFLLPPGRWRCRGVMRRVWRRGGWAGALSGPFLWLASLTDQLFPDTGVDVPFEMINEVGVRRDGRVSMTWKRTFDFGRRRRTFDELLVFDEKRGLVVVRVGRTRHLESELHVRIEGSGIAITSGRQWLRLGPVRIPLPELIVGRAAVRSWRPREGRLAISVTIHNTILGDFAGYEGEFDARFEPWAAP